MKHRIDLWSKPRGATEYAHWHIESDGIHTDGLYITGHDMRVNVDTVEASLSCGGVHLTRLPFNEATS